LHPILPWILAWLLLLAIPFCLTNAYTQFVVNVICINIILAVGLNIVKGFAGQVTVGHIALAAVGAYTSAVVSTKAGIPFWGALPLAMLLTAFAGAIVGIPSFRLEGAYLALATLGLAESVRIVISGTEWLGAAIGYEGIPPSCRWRLWDCISPSASCAPMLAALSRPCAKIRSRQRLTASMFANTN
jgi:branched-chain amino acid transport system permease protein